MTATWASATVCAFAIGSACTGACLRGPEAVAWAQGRAGLPQQAVAPIDAESSNRAEPEPIARPAGIAPAHPAQPRPTCRAAWPS